MSIRRMEVGMFQPEKLKKLREDRNLTIADAIYEFGKQDFRITRNTLENWEEGNTEPKANDMANLARFYGVSVDFFFNEKLIDL